MLRVTDPGLSAAHLLRSADRIVADCEQQQAAELHLHLGHADTHVDVYLEPGGPRALLDRAAAAGVRYARAVSLLAELLPRSVERVVVHGAVADPTDLSANDDFQQRLLWRLAEEQRHADPRAVLPILWQRVPEPPDPAQQERLVRTFNKAAHRAMPVLRTSAPRVVSEMLR